DCPIVFYYLDLAGLRHTDDLYIKMNARGVPLTSFENLKADLIRYIRTQAESEDVPPDERDRWRLLLGDDKSNIIAKIDTAWTDVFWTIRSEDDQIDEIYYAFLNRFLLNSWIVGEMKKQDVKPGDDLKFDYFYGRDPALRKDEGDDHRIAYATFDVYKEVLSINVVVSLFETLDNIVNFMKNKGEVPPPSWKEDEPSVLLPSYYKNEADKFIRDFAGREIRKVKPITQPQRVVFFALCKFFENGWEQDNDINNLKDWLRVVWNIVENANINSISSMIGCMRLIASIASHSHNILNYLAEAHENDIKSDFAKEQIREEALKARKIQSDGEWEGPILEAEKMPCLKGRIGVLFQNREATELNLFKQRLALLESILNLSQDNPYYLQKVLLSRWDSAGLSKTIDLSENDRDKKKLLTDTLSDCFRKIENNSIVINKNEWVNDLCQTDLLVHSRGKIVSFKTGVVVLWATSGQRWVFWGNYIKGNVILGRRRKLLTATDDIQLANENMRVGRTSFVSGRNIEFSFGGHWFQWKGTPNHEEADVYLLKDNWKDESNNIYQKHPDDPEKSGNGKQYYCFRVGMEEDVQSFKDKLSALISASQSG
ncbi:MAG: hypothetical protein GX936_09725, partial [Clostridiales bacterium]|nr:hypothetical protein [Clostridiales bacterium]